MNIKNNLFSKHKQTSLNWNLLKSMANVHENASNNLTVYFSPTISDHMNLQGSTSNALLNNCILVSNITASKHQTYIINIDTGGAVYFIDFFLSLRYHFTAYL